MQMIKQKFWYYNCHIYKAELIFSRASFLELSLSLSLYSLLLQWKVCLYNLLLKDLSYCVPFVSSSSYFPFFHNMCPNILTLNQTFGHRGSIILTRPSSGFTFPETYCLWISWVVDRISIWIMSYVYFV